jgi:predicted anti-sigma-YlaC factor YlaD
MRLVAAMTHRGWRRAVEAWVDGELGEVSTGLVLAHMSRCSSCTGHAAFLRCLKNFLRRQATPSLAALRLRRFARLLTDPRPSWPT